MTLQGMFPAIVPAPLSMTPKEGFFHLNEQTAVVASGDCEPLANRLREALGSATGFSLPWSSKGGTNKIVLRLNAELAAEGYRLSVSQNKIQIEGASPAGVFYGIQTLRQLLPESIFRSAPVGQSSWLVPAVEIVDQPRFPWRGAHLDVSRHFMPKEFIFKFLDLMALHKLNTFHWHLTDDQGWRIEIKKYPRLTAIGASRSDTMLRYSPPVYEGKPHGGFYTQEDAREVVAYAAQRFITVVPEIEMPGHAQAAIAAYPELGNTDQKLPVATSWGVIENVFNVEDTTIRFLQDVLDEVLKIFPSPYIHIGGDEVPKKQWKESPRAQEKMRSLGLKDEHELQSWFVRQMDAYLTAKGRRLIGWDEILEGGLAPGATVMSWRGTEGGIAAARSGHDVVMAPTSHTYLDYYQSKMIESEPWAIGGYLPLETVYSFEPVPSDLTPAQTRHILGAQAQLWTEYIRTPKHLEYMAFPRLCALAEVVWSTKEKRDFGSFQDRLSKHVRRLGILDVGFRPLGN